MASLIAVSGRTEDLTFAYSVAKSCQMELVTAARAPEVKEALKNDPKAIVFWDIDHSEALKGLDPTSIQSVGQVLRAGSSPERVFIISNEAINKTPYIFNMPVFGHHVYRQFQDPASQAIGNVVKALSSGTYPEVSDLLPQGGSVKRLTLKKSGERNAVAQAVHNLILKMGMPDRLATLASQATDELLMNAIFDAPSADGKAYKRQTERNKDFELGPKEMVNLDFGISPSYVAIGVSDQFGSLKKDTILGFIRRDYENQEYKVREGDPGAGLGIYGIVKSELSMLFSCKPRHETRVVVYIPVVKTMKALRSSFRFFSFI